MAKMLYQETGSEAGLGARPGEATQGDADGDRITITPSAAAEMKRQAEKRGTPGTPIRVGIRGGGCTGFSYLFDWADSDPREGDQVFTEHGVTIYVDRKSFKLLKGTVLDFVTSIMGHGFKFHNPNAKGTCGCGESVSF